MGSANGCSQDATGSHTVGVFKHPVEHKDRHEGPAQQLNKDGRRYECRTTVTGWDRVPRTPHGHNHGANLIVTRERKGEMIGGKIQVFGNGKLLRDVCDKHKKTNIFSLFLFSNSKL